MAGYDIAEPLARYVAFLATPITTIVCSARWLKDNRDIAVLGIASVIGRALTAGAIAGLTVFALYAVVFPIRLSGHYDSLVLAYKFAGAFCVIGFFATLLGACRNAEGRWFALGFSLSIGALWLIGGVMIDPI